MTSIVADRNHIWTRLGTWAATVLAVSLLAFAASAQPHRETPQCQAPISTCADADPACPEGYACACVPSCAGCRDCATRVCIEAVEAACETACDCAPGLGCFDGECIAGFAPVFCCDEHPCPKGQQCQSRDGEMGQCARDCERVRERAATKIDRAVMLAARCTRDQQCVRVETWTDCQGTCGAWVNQRYAPLVRRVVRYADERICNAYDGCPFAAPRCVAERGVCSDGRCAGESAVP